MNPINDQKFLYLEQYNIQTHQPAAKELRQPVPEEASSLTEAVENYEDFDDTSDYLDDSQSEFSVLGETTNQEQDLNLDAAQEIVAELWQGIRNGDLIGAARAELAQQVRELEVLINTTSTDLPDQTVKKLNALQGKILGTGPAANSPAVEDPFGIDEVLAEEDNTENESKVLLGELQNFRDLVQKNTNLSKDAKKDFADKLELWVSNLELSPGEESQVQIKSEFDALKEEFSQVSNFAPAVSRLASLTGADPETIEKLMDKHGLDPKQLPATPDQRVAALLSDSQLPSQLSGLLNEHQNNYNNLKGRVDTEIANANATNAANDASDTSKKDTSSFTSHAWLYNANFRRDEFSKQLINNREKIATETSNLLSALYGEDIKIKEGADDAGKIVIGGKEINVLASGGANSLDFGTADSEWPPVELVPAWIDDEGDGKTSVVAWMREANYPYHIYDTGGALYSASGNWNWKKSPVQDIEREV